MSGMGSQISGRNGTILLATLGEQKTIRFVLEEIAESVKVLEASEYQLEILVVDDSSDSEFIDYVNNSLLALGLSGSVIEGPNMGLGAAILSGFRFALSN